MKIRLYTISIDIFTEIKSILSYHYFILCLLYFYRSEFYLYYFKNCKSLCISNTVNKFSFIFYSNNFRQNIGNLFLHPVPPYFPKKEKKQVQSRNIKFHFEIKIELPMSKFNIHLFISLAR